MGEHDRQRRRAADLGRRAREPRSTACRSTRTATSPALLGSLQRLHGRRRRRGRAPLRLPRRDVPHAADDRRPLRAGGAGRPGGSRSRPPRSAALPRSGRSPSPSTATTRTCSRLSSRRRSAIAALALAAWLVYAGTSGLGVRDDRGSARSAAVATLFTGLYPRVMVSSPDFGNSLTVAERRRPRTTRSQVMTVVARDRDAGRAALPGLDVPRLPRPARRDAERRRSAGRLQAADARARPAPPSPRPRRRARCSPPTSRSGSATALLVLAPGDAARATSSRAAFYGASLRAVAVELVLLALAFAGRGVLAWGFEVAGRARRVGRCSPSCGSTLVERRLRSQPAALDGVEAARSRRPRVQGVDGLEAYFAPLPAAGRAGLRRPARGARLGGDDRPRLGARDARSRCRSCRCSCG